MGHRSLSAGKSFEEFLNFLHDYYEKMGRVHIEYAGTRSRAVKTKRGDLRFVAGYSLPDYVGTIAPSGRAIVFDAKTTKNKYTWSLHKDRVHQRDTLSKWSKMGAIAFFMVERRPVEKLYLLRVQPDKFDPVHPPPKITWSHYRGWTNKPNALLLKVEADKMGTYDYLSIIQEFWINVATS